MCKSDRQGGKGRALTRRICPISTIGERCVIAGARHGRVANGGGATRPVVSELVENSTHRGAVVRSPTSASSRIARNETTEGAGSFPGPSARGGGPGRHAIRAGDAPRLTRGQIDRAVQRDRAQRLVEIQRGVIVMNLAENEVIAGLAGSDLPGSVKNLPGGPRRPRRCRARSR